MTHIPLNYQQQLAVSPMQTPFWQTLGSAPTSSGSGAMSEDFPPYSCKTTPTYAPTQQPSLPSPSWQSHVPAASSAPTSSRNTRAVTSPTGSSQSQSTAKTSRQQFTACGACRHRRVKCDLMDIQEEVERIAAEEDHKGVGPQRGSTARRRKVFCINCIERGTNCV